MIRWQREKITRRAFVGVPIAGAVLIALGCGDDDSTTEGGASATATDSPSANGTAVTTEPQALAPTPSCTDEDDATPDQTEGPYFTPDSPERASLLEDGMAGDLLVVSGFVLATDCQPVANALLDFWQANDNGEYDNEGYVLRGHQFSGEDGSFRLETIVPGIYTGRTRHIHVKVQAPDQPILTTQLYFPAEAGNAADGIFDEALLMDVQEASDGKAGGFTFVLDIA